MSEITTPPTARTDVRPGTPAPTADRPPRTRAVGVGLAVTATVFAATMAFGGPEASDLTERMIDLTGLAFQLGLFGLLGVMLRTAATGTGRAGRGLLHVERVVLAVASLWSVLHAVVPPAVQEAPWMVAMDMFWPLSMFGMTVVGVTVAVVGRWRGLLRWWTAAGCAWFVASIPVAVLFPEGPGQVVGVAYMIIGFGGIGVLLALRPGLPVRG
jgi:hypothetical protein